jgi:hypothetical protein
LIENKSKDYVVLTAVGVMLVAFVIFGGIVSSTANAQNSSYINSNGLPTNGTAKTATANQTNKTVAAPGTATTIVTAGNKTIVLNTPASTTRSGPANLNRTGFTNLYVITSPTGKTFPLKYSIKGGKVAGMLADKDRTTLVLVLDPSQKGGNMTIELPRNIIDSKGASNSDTKYQIKMVRV